MLLVDASVYIFRAFHSLPSSMTGRGGQPVNAIYGYATFLAQLLTADEDHQVAAAFDESLTCSFRNTLYADYKANREAPPPELEAQIATCREISQALGVSVLTSPGYEADDLIGTLARTACTPVTIVTADKDLAQLLGEDDMLWDYARKTCYDRATIKARFGVFPEQIADYLALVGDRVDNIPGVPGIGARTAAALLARFGDLETLLSNTAHVAESGMRGAVSLARRLDDHAGQARLSHRLATIVTDVALDERQLDIERRAPDTARLAGICDGLGAGARLRVQLGLESA